MECKFCKAKCQKAGHQKNGSQKLYCVVCKKYQQEVYIYNACKTIVKHLLPKLVVEGVGIRGISRVLKIATGTVLSHIKNIARGIIKPPIILNNEELQVDELRTYIGRKKNEYWIAYAYNKATGKVIDFIVGKRSKRTLRMLINTLLISGVKRIFTDHLNIYKSIIPKAIHSPGAYLINHIERNNLNLRTNLKCLSRKTICFSKSYAMLVSCLTIYFWFYAAIETL